MKMKMATKKPLKQKTIENPSVDYIRAGKEKALARLHKVLKTLDANGNDDDVFKASKVKVSPRPGKSATPESSPKDSYGPGYINNYDSMYAALKKDFPDHAHDYADFDAAPVEETEIDEATATRKHFQQVADIVKHIEDPKKRKELAHHHASIFKLQNPRFDHKRFLAAANVHEDTQMFDEKLAKNASTKEIIDDFIASDAPQFQGKSKAKRIQMAVAASYKNEETIDEGRKAMPLHGHENHYKSDDELRYIAKDAHAAAENFKGSGMRVPGSHIEAENKYRDQMHDALTVLHHRSKGGKRLERPKTNEETLHEISNKILSRYANKAQDDVTVRRFLGGSKDKANKRKEYIEKADKKVTGEETINELSPEKLTAYSAKASASHTDAILSADKKKVAKRTIGMGKAKALIRSNEEVKLKSLEEVSKDLLSRYAAKAASSKTDAILSVNKRKIANRTVGLGKAKALSRSDEEIEEAAAAHKGPKRRSASAAALRLPLYRKKVIPSGKVYNRKHKNVNEASRLPKGITAPGEIRKYLAMIARQNKEKVAQVAKALKKAEHSKHKVKKAHYDYHDHDRHDDHHVRKEH
jgi:hypothetical protein